MSRQRRGRGEGSVYFHKRLKRWCAILSSGYDEQGRQRRKSVYGRTKAEAQKKLRDLQGKVGSGMPIETSREKVGPYLRRWLEHTARPTIRPSTHRSYHTLITVHIAPRIGGYRLASLKPAHLQPFFTELERDGRSPRRRQQVYAVLHKALNDAMREETITRNPMTKVVPRPKWSAPEIKVLTEQETSRFLKAAKVDRLQSLYILALQTGMRWGELAGLRWSDVEFDKGYLRVRRQLTEDQYRPVLDEPKTTAGKRDVPLTPIALDALKDHRKRMLAEGHHRADGLMFVDTQGQPLRGSNVYRRSFVKILERAGLPVTNKQQGIQGVRFHDLRHTAATLLRAAGLDLKVLQTMLGHARISHTLDLYGHVTPMQLETAAAQIGAYFATLPKPRAEGPKVIRLPRP